MEEYKEYRFNLLEYYELDIDDIINKAKELVGIETIGILWPPMNNNIDEAVQLVKKKPFLKK